MKTTFFSMSIFCLFFTGITGIAQDDPVSKGLNAITREAVRGQMEFLASDWTQGREIGTQGIYMAADYIASIFKIYGLQPGGDEITTSVSWREMREGKRPETYRTYFQNITFIEYSDAGNNEFSLYANTGRGKYRFNEKTDFQVLPSDVGVEVDAPVVFVGYGYVNSKHAYDDFKGVDVRNKVILCLPGFPGKDTTHIVVIGGHYDNLGIRDGFIWNGADDNASGTVGVMTNAKAFMATGVKPEKTIVFAAWTGEEYGLFGSTYFTNHLPVPKENVVMYLNYDMISRDNSDDTSGVGCILTYTSGYKSFEENTVKFNEEQQFGLDISFRSDPCPADGSDQAPFALNNIPIMYFEAGFPPEYHQPDDHLELVNWDKMIKIIKLGFLNTWQAANGELKKISETE